MSQPPDVELYLSRLLRGDWPETLDERDQLTGRWAGRGLAQLRSGTADQETALGDAHMIGLVRAMLYHPRWPWHAAAHFGETVVPPNQYLRCAPRHARSLFRAANR